MSVLILGRALVQALFIARTAPSSPASLSCTQIIRLLVAEDPAHRVVRRLLISPIHACSASAEARCTLCVWHTSRRSVPPAPPARARRGAAVWSSAFISMQSLMIRPLPEGLPRWPKIAPGDGGMLPTPVDLVEIITAWGWTAPRNRPHLKCLSASRASRGRKVQVHVAAADAEVLDQRSCGAAGRAHSPRRTRRRRRIVT